jgi:hypothetical protein
MVTGSFCHVNCTNSIKLGHISVVPDSHEVWPLGKLLKPSLTTLGTPWWHMTSVVILSNTLTCIYQSNCCKGAVNKCAISKGEKNTGKTKVYRFSVREAAPEEVWARTAHCVLDCIGEDPGYQHGE